MLLGADHPGVTEADLEADPDFAFWVNFRIREWPVEPFTEWPLTTLAVVGHCDGVFFAPMPETEKKDSGSSAFKV